MTAEDYVRTYLQLWCWVNDTFTVVQVRNYLQSGLGTQASRAAGATRNYWPRCRRLRECRRDGRCRRCLR